MDYIDDFHMWLASKLLQHEKQAEADLAIAEASRFSDVRQKWLKRSLEQTKEAAIYMQIIDKYLAYHTDENVES